MVSDNWQVFATLAVFASLFVIYRLGKKVASRYVNLTTGWVLKTLVWMVIVSAVIYFLAWGLGPVYGINEKVTIVQRDTPEEGKVGIIRDWESPRPGGFIYHVDYGAKELGKFHFQELKRFEGPCYIPSVFPLILMIIGSLIALAANMDSLKLKEGASD